MITIKAKTTEQEQIIRVGISPEADINYGELKEIATKYGIKHKKKKLVVQRVLEKIPGTTINDRILDLECLKAEYPEDIKMIDDKEWIIFMIKKETLPHITTPESYSRARRSLNSQGIGLPVLEHVLEERMKREKGIRKFFTDQKKEK